MPQSIADLPKVDTAGASKLPRSKFPDRDSSLLALVQQGDEQAMACLYDSHSRIVFAVALRVLQDRSAAEDILQDVFLSIWRNSKSFLGERGNLGGWLAIVARNRAIDLLRKKKPMVSVDDVPLAAPGCLAKDVERLMLVTRLKPLIAKLPEGQQTVLELAFSHGLTHAEIAQRTQTPLGTVKTRIRVALLALRRSLVAEHL